MKDLRNIGVEALTLGQYLRSSSFRLHLHTLTHSHSLTHSFNDTLFSLSLSPSLSTAGSLVFTISPNNDVFQATTDSLHQYTVSAVVDVSYTQTSRRRDKREVLSGHQNAETRTTLSFTSPSSSSNGSPSLSQTVTETTKSLPASTSSLYIYIYLYLLIM